MKRSIDSFLDALVEDEELTSCTTRLYPSFIAKLDDLARKVGTSRTLLIRRFLEVGYEELREPLEAAAALRAEQREAAQKARTQTYWAKRRDGREAKAS